MSDTIPGPDDGGPVYGFHGDDCRRIRAAVQRKEGYYLNRQPRRGRWPGASGGGGIFADSGSGFAAGSRSSPSNAMVTLLEDNGSGGLTTSTNQVKAYNHSATAIGVSKTIVLSLFAGRYRVEQVIDC